MLGASTGQSVDPGEGCPRLSVGEDVDGLGGPNTLRLGSYGIKKGRGFPLSPDHPLRPIILYYWAKDCGICIARTHIAFQRH